MSLNRNRRRIQMSRTVRVLLVFVAALWLFGERAAAQIPATDGTFYACVRVDRDGDEGRLARLVAANEPCRRNETRVHWSQAGAQGVRGTNGTNGAPGIIWLKQAIAYRRPIGPPRTGRPRA